MDLVPVKPMESPRFNNTFYLDYKYKRTNIFKRIFNRIFSCKTI
jgi:hypothetical protein